MTDARLDAAQVVALTRNASPPRQLDAAYIAALSTGSPVTRFDAAYLAVLTPAALSGTGGGGATPTYQPVSGVTPSASSSLPTAPASNLFGGTTAYWEAAVAATAQAPISVIATLDQPKKVDQYGLAARADRPDKAPASWTFEGSLDGVTWVVLDTQTGQVFSASQTKKYTNGNASTSYPYYRLQITVGGVTSEAPSFNDWLLNAQQPAVPGVTIGTSTFTAAVRLFGTTYNAGDLIPDTFTPRLQRWLVKRGYVTPAGTLLVKRPVKVDGTAYAAGATWAATVVPKVAKKLLRGRYIGK